MLNVEQIKSLFDNASLETINLSDVVLNAGTQMREKTDSARIEDYREAMANGDAPKFPPIKLIALKEPVTLPDGVELMTGALILVDGFHRCDGAVKAKLAKFQAEIVEGDLETAKYYAMTANSDHGVSLKGKDYQNAIRELYELNASWREHGKQKEIAALFGCSTKTVERALKVVKAAIKAEAFKMFEQGATDQQVADFAVMHVKTAAEWREDWEDSKPKEKEDKEDKEPNNKEDKEPDTNNPMDLTMGQVLRLKDKVLKAKLLKLLMDSIKADNETEEPEPQPEPEPHPEPEEAEEEPEETNDDSYIADLAKQWKGKTCWEILGKTKEELGALKNPKTGLKRAYTKQLKGCHSDQYDNNEALEILKDALSQASKYFK